MNIHQVQPQGVGDHAEAAEAHGGSGKHGAKADTQSHQGPRRDGDAHGVIEEGPEQVLVDVAQSGAAEADGSADIQQAALHQHQVRRVHGNVRPGADGDAHIRTLQGRSVIDAVAHHGGLSLLTELLDHRRLAVGQDAGNNLIHSRLLSDCLSGAPVVAGEHHYLNAHVLQLGDGLRTVRLDHVRHGDEAQQFPIPGEEQGCFALGGKLRRPLLHRIAHLGKAADEVQAASGGGSTGHLGLQAVAGQGLEVPGFADGQLFLFRPGQDGLGQGVLAAAFQTGGKAEQLRPGDAFSGENIGDLRGAGGDGAGFIQDHCIHLAGDLQGSSGFEQDAVPGAQAAAHHDGYRRGQTQGAGAADHQHRNAPGQGKAQAPAQQQPHRRGHQGDGDHRRDEHAGDLVRHLGDGGLGGGSVADHADDLAEGGVLPYPQGLTADVARLVHGGGGDPVPCRFIHGDALAGEGGLIHAALALQNDPVHRDALPGPDSKNVTLFQFFNRDLPLLPIFHDGGGFGGQVHQAADGIGGLALAAGLQHLAHGDQGQDHGGRFKVEVHHIAHDGLHISPHLSPGHGKERIGAVDKGRAGAQSHQTVHIGGAVHQALEAADEKLLVDDHDDAGQQQLGQAHGHMVIREEGRQGPAPHHMPHGQIHQDQQKTQRGE